MTTLTLAIVIVFCIGYFFIAIESVTKINKAAIALLILVTWNTNTKPHISRPHSSVLIISNRTLPFPHSSVPSALSLAESTSMTLPKGLIPSSIMMKRNSWHPKAQSGNVEEGLCRIWQKCLGQRKYNRQVGKMMICDKKVWNYRKKTGFVNLVL